MASTIQRKLITLDPGKTQSCITQLHFVYGKDIIYVEAIVEDIQLIRSQTILDPEEYGPALCYTYILWDEDVTEENEPCLKEIDDMVNTVPSQNWTLLNREHSYEF